MQKAPSQFYGGISVTGTVHPLPVSSWTQFVKDILSHPQRLNVTRDEYHKLDEKAQQRAKRVKYVTPATFKAKDVARTYANAKDISLVALDIDVPDIARPFVNDPEVLRTLLHPLAFAAYTTATSTADKPKLRIMVAAEHFPPDLYRAAVLLLVARLGMPRKFKGIKESQVCVQPMYLPTVFKDEDPSESDPLLIALTTGKAISKTDCLVGDNDREAKTYKDGKTFVHIAADADDDTLMHLKAPVDNVSLTDAGEALQHLNPDCDRHEWLQIAAALRHQFPRGEEHDQAYTAFDTWSAKGTKYQGEDDTRAMWDSLSTTPKGREPVTIRTLFARAKTAGWAGSVKNYKELVRWLTDPDRTADQLREQGPPRIAKAENISTTQKEMATAELLRVMRKEGVAITLSILRKAVRKHEHFDERPAAFKGDEAKFPKWAQGLMYVSDNNEFYHRLSNSKFSPEALDNVYGANLMSPENDMGRPSVRPRDFLLNVLQISRVNNFQYDPAHPEDSILHVEGKRFVNLYMPTYPEPDEDDADFAAEVMLLHMKNLIAEKEYRKTLLDFLAYQVQHPGKKIRWATLLQGAEGCGKTALAEMMRTVLGPTNVKIMDAGQLFSQFNGWAMGAQLVAMEEVRVVGHNRYDVMNRLKPCITNETVMINDKRDKLQQVPNISNYLMFTNHHDSLAVSSGDRRYFVLNSQIQDKDQIEDMGGPAYFNKLFKVIEKHGPGLRHWLENLKLGETFNPNGRAPVTRYLAYLQDAASTPLAAAIKSLLDHPEQGHPLVRPDLISSRALRQSLELDNGLPRLNDQMVTGCLRELGFSNVARTIITDTSHELWSKRNQWPSAKAAQEAAQSRANGRKRSLL